MTRRISLLLLALLVAGSAWAGTWRPITPDGGSIQALASAPGAGQIVYAVSFRGTVLRSSDGARTWSPRKGQLGNRFVSKLSVDPADPDVLYADTFNSLLKSADGGESWSRLLEGGAFALAPSDPKVLYAARNEEVLRSDDAGATWTVVRLGTGRIEHLAVGPGDSRLVYAVGAEGFFRSEDGGATWVEVGALAPQGERVFVQVLAVDQSEPSALYAGEWSGRVFKSDDRGATWSLLWEGPASFGGLLRALKVDPADGRIHAVFDFWIFRSSDGGASWSLIFSGDRITGFDFHSGTPRLYAGTRGGVHLSEDAGQSWTSANRGFQELAFLRVAADPHTPGMVFTAADPELVLPFGPVRPYLLKTVDGGASWTAPFGTPDASPYVHDLAADPSRPGTWYLASSGVWKTLDGGETWEKANQGLRPVEYVASIALAPSNPDALYAIGWDSFPICGFGCPEIRVFRSLDAAAQWQPSRVQGLKHLELPGSLAVDSAKASTVYAAGPGIFRSTDGGKTWKKTVRGLGNAFVAQVVADPFESGTLYAIVEAKRGWRVFKSTDHGATWAAASKGVPSRVSVSQLAPDPTSPGTLYAATTLGVYVTRNGGKLWTAMNEGLGNRPVFTVAVDPLRPEILYAGGEDGLFRFE